MTAKAADLAGHKQTVQFNFEVYATYDSLASISDSFMEVTGAPGAEGIAKSLKQKLMDAKLAAEQGNIPAARNKLQDFINQVTALSGKKVTKEQAAVLVRWPAGCVIMLEEK